MNITNLSILLVEDEPDQVRRVQQVLSESHLVNPLRVVADAEQAIACLSASDRGGGPLPALALIDLSLPGLSGQELLKWIRSQDELRHLPVALLVPPSDGGESSRTQEFGDHSCLVKPVEVESLLAIVQSMNVYWMLLDQIPAPHPPGATAPGGERLMRVLVADRDLDFLHGIREALRRRAPPMIVDIATTMTEALERMIRNEPDAVALDSGLAEGDTLARIRSWDNHLPVIFLYEEESDPAGARAVDAGAWAALVKQVRLDRFADQLHEELLRSRKTVPPVPPAPPPDEVIAPEPKVRAHRRGDTDILGGRIDFQETSWDLVQSAQAAESLDELIRLYWKPLYFFVRQQGYDNETAKDAVQEFLLSALEHETIPKADRARGRFRTFLLASLGNFLRDRYRSSARQKRGGGRIPLSLDSEAFHAGRLSAIASRDRPEMVIDRTWARDILQRCISELQGKPSHLQAFELNLNGMEYSGISRETGLGEAAAKTAVHRLRRKLGGIIRRHFRGPMSTEEDVEVRIDEFSSLLR